MPLPGVFVWGQRARENVKFQMDFEIRMERHIYDLASKIKTPGAPKKSSWVEVMSQKEFR